MTENLDRAQLSALIFASKLLNATLDRDQVLRKLMMLAAAGVDADRATLYLVDRARHALCSIVVLGEELCEIVMPLEEGLAGHVARTGETVNVQDAYADPHFSPRVDKETGYHTDTVLAVPMYNARGRIEGVVQAINKHGAPFSEADAQYLAVLAEHAAQALENAHLHSNLSVELERVSFLYRIGNLMRAPDITETSHLRSVLFDVLENTSEVLRADSATLLLWHPQRQCLVFVAVAGLLVAALEDMDVPLEGSIAGWVYTHNRSIAINDVQHDPRYYHGIDEQTGIVTRQLIAAPLRLGEEVVGALEVMNKQGCQPFTADELQLAQDVADQIAMTIESTGQYESLIDI